MHWDPRKKKENLSTGMHRFLCFLTPGAMGPAPSSCCCQSLPCQGGLCCPIAASVKYSITAMRNVHVHRQVKLLLTNTLLYTTVPTLYTRPLQRLVRGHSVHSASRSVSLPAYYHSATSREHKLLPTLKPQSVAIRLVNVHLPQEP